MLNGYEPARKVELDVQGQLLAALYYRLAHFFIRIFVCFSSRVALQSPHRYSASPSARDLDKKLGSYFLVQFITNVLLTLLTMYPCLERGTRVIATFFICTVFGGSVLAANLLCHRYFLAKAKALNPYSEDDGESVGIMSVVNLEASYKFEIKVFTWVPPAAFAMGIVLWFVGFHYAGYATAGFAVVMVLLASSTFSVISTAIFLTPILGVLRVGEKGTKYHRMLRRTKYMTLTGAGLVFLSSTVLLVEIIVYFFYQPQIRWLKRIISPFVVGNNANRLEANPPLLPLYEHHSTTGTTTTFTVRPSPSITVPLTINIDGTLM
jgi:hypothetical protein